MLVVRSHVHRRHDPAHEVQHGREIPIHEVPARADSIEAGLAADDRFAIADPVEHGRGPIEAVHDPALVAYLARAWEDWAAAVPDRADAIPDTFPNPALRAGMGPGRPPHTPEGRLGWYCFDTATPIVAGTYVAARAAVDVALTAADAVLAGAPAAYALCRPPGHHAPRAAFGGYCYCNNAAIAAQYAIDAGASRVAVLDVDYHHGNGTQQVFYERGDVLFVSLHADPDRAYPYVTGHADETGSGAGLGRNLNLLLDVGADDETYLRLLARALDAVEAFDPEVLVVSLGVDTYRLDPIGDLAVTGDAYGPAGRAVASLGRPLVIVQEGGYHLPSLGANIRAWLLGAASVPGLTPPALSPPAPSGSRRTRRAT